MNYTRLFFLLLLLSTVNIVAREHILSFLSDITVQSDATLTVTETITVQSEGQEIVHGIMREFPKRYKDRFGHAYNVGFVLHSAQQEVGQGVLHDIPVKMVERGNGVVMYLGDPNARLKPGTYTYVIRYSVTRILGFFKEYDELYWNITGNGWRFPIDEAQAAITLPAGIPRNSLVFDAYTGAYGAKGKDFTSSFDASGRLIFRTTRSLSKYHGLTVAVSWPKGFIREPGAMTKFWWFLYDNLNVLLLLLGLLIVFIVYFFAWLDVRRRNLPGTIIPLFKPPFDPTSEPRTSLLPSQIRFLYRKGYDAQALSAEIVNLAVLGYLTIDYYPGFFEGTYTLRKTQKLLDRALPLHCLILDTLFSFGSQKIELTHSSASALGSLAKKVDAWLRKSLKTDNFATKTEVIVAGILLSVIVLVAAFVLVPGPLGVMTLVLVGLLIGVNSIFAFNLVYYTPAGRKLMDEIEGFELFLETAEKPRFKIIGTPPTKTPQLYEQYLPYAMALGVEEQWTKQFTSVFNKLKEKGIPYYPLWYHTPRMTLFNPVTFSSNLRSSLNAAISSSAQAPGTSSGSRGGGSSGGGGGGGGGGGW